MIIKKYQAKTENDALNLAKDELGDDVVLMNSKVIKPKGILRLFKSSRIEVTVAKEEEEIIRKKVDVVASSKDNETKTEENKAKADAITSTAHVDAYIKDDVLGEKLDNISSLLEQQIKKDKEAKLDTPVVTEAPKVDTEVKTPGKRDDVLNLIRQMLKDNEIDAQYIDMILEDAVKNLKPDTPMDQILSHIYQRMILYFGKPETIAPAEKNPKVIFFVGTTGVGKTTTIAKIASDLVINGSKRVALFTCDTYRIAAVEQLRTYASILELPLTVVYDNDDLMNAIKDSSNYDYILVDTAGHSHLDSEKRDATFELVACARELAETDVYLVLSAATKYKDLLNIADNYKEMGEYKLVFTKLDETGTYGNILNLRMYTGSTLSYVTYGQDVPNDIDTFNAQGTVKKLLGGE